MTFDDPYDPTGGADPAGSGNWWEGPPPPGYTGPWPPPLPPGASYGADFGSIIYAAQPGLSVGSQPSTDSPIADPKNEYHPEYWNNQPAPTTTSGGGGGYGGGGSSTPTTPTTLHTSIDYGPTTTAPTPDLPPVPNAPAFQPPPAFSFDPFNAPNPQDVLNDPSYQFELQQGLGAIGHKAASLGTLNTGGTIGDFVNYGQGLASTHWNDLFNQKLSAYQTNRQNALDQYNTNYNTQYKDPYQINYQTQYRDPFMANYTRATDLYNAQQHNYDQGLYYNTHANDQNQYYNWQNTLFGHQVSQDDFNNRLRLLGLIQ